MMGFTVEQLSYLRGAAERLLFDLEERTSKFQYTKEQKVGVICGHLQEICSTGYSIAFDEVRSTPWEYRRSEISEVVMNTLSEEGWEPLMTHGSDNRWLIWRRRRAVREIEKTFELPSS